MTTVEDIERAAERLSPDEFVRLAQWVGDRHHQLWTKWMETDAAAGKLDFLFEEADEERSAGVLRDWPSDVK